MLPSLAPDDSPAPAVGIVLKPPGRPKVGIAEHKRHKGPHEGAKGKHAASGVDDAGPIRTSDKC